MTHLLQKLAMTTVGLTLGLAALDVNSSLAATISYDFVVSIDSGSLVSQTYTGTLSFDDSSLVGVDSEFLPVAALEFNFLGINYTTADAPNKTEVAFFDGDFLGLAFSTDASFSFIPGFFALDEAFFTYDISQGSGTGEIAYTLISPKPIPESRNILGLVLVTGFGVIVSARQQANCRL